MYRLLILLPLLVLPPARGDGLVLDVKEGKRVTGVLSYDVICPKLRAKTWVLFAAQAPELPGQVNVLSRLSHKTSVAKDLNGLPRSLLVAQVPATPATSSRLQLRLTYEATLRSRYLRPLRPGETKGPVEGLSPADRKWWLASHGDIDLTSAPFRKWMADQELARRPKESDVAFARRTFQAIRNGFTYEFRDNMNRRTGAVCQAKKSDCGGLGMLFTAVMRVNKVPARTLWGRWALSTKTGEKLGDVDYHQWHVKAEFYADGVGWVPVDLSSGILHDRSRAGLRYFGRDDGDFITFHVDPDLRVNAFHFGKQTIGNLQTPAFWVTGSGTVEPRTGKELWLVR